MSYMVTFNKTNFNEIKTYGKKFVQRCIMILIDLGTNKN